MNEEPKATITIFTTASGSTYQVDKVGKKIRRFSGENSGRSSRISEEWKAFDQISSLKVGSPATIVWTNQESPRKDTPEGAAYVPYTLTNVISSVVEEDQIN